MSAQHIFETAPLGATISYTDGLPKPPARFTVKLRTWDRANGEGRLIRKKPARSMGSFIAPASFTLDRSGPGAFDDPVIAFHQVYSVASPLQFAIVALPPAGSVLVLSDAGHDAQLLHLAADRAGAEAWRVINGYPDAVLQDVAAEAGDGRAVA